jgi:acyl carrier protein
MMTIDDIRDLVALQLGLRSVAAGDRLIEDLGAESADVVNLVAAVEDKYGIEIAEEEIADLRTVGDVFELARSRIG